MFDFKQSTGKFISLSPETENIDERTLCLKYERVPYVFLHLLNTILINEMYSEVFHRLVNPRGLSGKACRVLRGLSIITLI